MPVETRPIACAELAAVREAFSTSASSFVMPVTEIDGTPVGTGSPGALTLAMRERYIAYARESAT